MGRVAPISLLILLTASITSLVSAQPPGFDPEKGHEMRHKHGWGKMSANIENLRILKLLEAVDLTEEQSEKFVPLFHSFRKDTKDLRQERSEMLDGIKDLAKQNDSDDKIRAELAKLRQNREKIDARQEKFLAECEAILDLQQLARLIIFQERFERDMLEAIREFRQHSGPRSGNHRKGKI